MRMAAFRGLSSRGVVGVGIATVLLLACESGARHSAEGGTPAPGPVAARS